MNLFKLWGKKPDVQPQKTEKEKDGDELQIYSGSG